MWGFCVIMGYMQEITHGMTKTKIYRKWAAMKHRCNNPANEFYSIYGGRGIKVCDKWQKFEGFWEDVMPLYYPVLVKNPGKRISIDRIDNDGDYELGNIQFLTVSEHSTKNRGSAHPNRKKPKPFTEGHRAKISQSLIGNKRALKKP